ncbi:hypothetical protein OSB04_001979 [Centaurea solstitialis]|uniref:F-box protein n=1 Tax=Centaurea solstitialis TaxID=347529 RepID=A0AA38TZK7_9ASTR|nr:hypothetical protein OSB04_001979 [Centaurea solstitialis]
MPSSETRNWLEMPDEIMGGMILQRLDALEILTNTQKVCMNWRRICKDDPQMWKKIEICHRFDSFYTDDYIKNLSKQAVHRSHGELMDISLKGFYTDDLPDYISRCVLLCKKGMPPTFGASFVTVPRPAIHLYVLLVTIKTKLKFCKLFNMACYFAAYYLLLLFVGKFSYSFTHSEICCFLATLIDITCAHSSSKLNRLCLTGCSNIMDCGLINALERLPHLETLKLSYMSIRAEDINVIGQNCPQLKSFTLKKEFMDADGDVYAIADSMPTLCHLKLVDSTMENDDGIQAILNECPRLESLDLRGCPYLHLDGNLEKLCRERIKDFKYTIPEGYDDSEMEFAIYDMNLYVGREMPHEIMGAMILKRLDVVEILTSAEKVWTTWRMICKSPAMWKIIDLDFCSSVWYTKNDFEKLCMQAVHRSCRELIGIGLKCFGTDDLLDFISRW